VCSSVIEEAQSVLGGKLDDSSPYVEWVKEGRKYDLGAVLVTQQPGALAGELLSQADNWFCFHLLSESDARTLSKHNSHFSDDILSHLIGEPIPGNCYMWSAPHQPFVLPVRVRDFGALYQREIVADDSAKAKGEAAGVQEMTEHLRTTFDDLAEALKNVLAADNRVRFVPLNIRGEQRIGIKSGQLYHLIRDLKDASITQPEDSLKKPLLESILGEGSVEVHRENGTDYFCAKKEIWETRLNRDLSSL
jgi:hypothetical protein